MKTKLLLAFACTVAFLGAARAADTAKPASQLTVNFIAPEKFTDVRDESGSDLGRDHMLDQIRDIMQTAARDYIAPGQTLEINVTDIDLAGDFEPWRGIEFSHIRVMKDIYPPRMDLEFKLLDADGKVVKEGKRHLQDLAFLMNISLPTTDTLRFDREMIRSWVRSEFKRAS